MTEQPHELKICYQNPKELKLNPRNSRTHSKKQLHKIAQSIEKLGFNNPVLVDTENFIIAGHGRVLAAKELGLNDDRIKEWQFKRNLLPNLQFLEGTENESKNKTPLKTWVEDDGNDFEYHPQGVSLELNDFDTFFEERRKLIKKELLKEFGLPESIPENLKESAE